MTAPKGVKDPVAQGGLESVSKAERVASLTGIRAVAALLVMATHAAYTTGKYTHGYLGLVYSRMEIGVPMPATVGTTLASTGSGSGGGAGGPRGTRGVGRGPPYIQR